MTAEAEAQHGREEEESCEPLHSSETTSESLQLLGSPAAPPTQGEAFLGQGDWQHNKPHLVSLQAEAGGKSLVPQPAPSCPEVFSSQDIPPF